MKINLQQQESFENRHHGKSKAEMAKMLEVVKVNSLDELIEQTEIGRAHV